MIINTKIAKRDFEEITEYAEKSACLDCYVRTRTLKQDGIHKGSKEICLAIRRKMEKYSMLQFEFVIFSALQLKRWVDKGYVAIRCETVPDHVNRQGGIWLICKIKPLQDTKKCPASLAQFLEQD